MPDISYATCTEELKALIGGNERLMVTCYEDWCPASSQSKPVFERLAASSRLDVTFCKVRTDMSPDINAALEVQAIPSFYYFEDGALKGILEGSVSEEELSGWLADQVREGQR